MAERRRTEGGSGAPEPMGTGLVYFEGCPHVEEARANLRRALHSLGRAERFREWVQHREETPAWADRLPSPTVLVDGRSVAGAAPDAEGPACAPGGAPSADAIRAALASAGGG